MAETQRVRPTEYYNPRPLILGMCFCWGVAMGFCLFYFSPPKQMMPPEQRGGNNVPDAPRSQLTDQERRRIDEPQLADVQPAPETSTQLPAFETMIIEPHMPAVTTEGGLTGRTAQPVARRPERPYSDPAPARRAPTPAAPPPIPELMP
jgi:hypothetical protein